MNTTTPNITGSAEIQMSFTALVKAYSNHWLGCGMTADEISVCVGVPAYRFKETGWLRQELRAQGALFWPAGQLQQALLRDVEQAMRDVTEVAEPIHVSTFPIPHVVEPTPNETIAARQIESRASNSSPATARADAVAFSNGASVSMPAAPVNARVGVGRWDGNPVQGSGLTRDLSEVIGVLKVAGDSVRERLTEITADQEEAGWTDRTQVFNAVAHLRRLASDLFNELSDFELKSQLNLHLRRR